MDNTKNKNKKYDKKMPSDCNSCLYYDYDEESDSYECMLSLDEDEYVRLVGYGSKGRADCPYYRFYDEYKSVQKQN